MDDCIFCKIINKQMPSYKVYEDDDVLAFLDISQVTKGHTLVIPKLHYTNFAQCSDNILSKVMIVSKKISQTFLNKLNIKGVNILSNINEIAGQSVFHFHVHVIPINDENEIVEMKFNNNYEKYKNEMEAIAESIKMNL